MKLFYSNTPHRVHGQEIHPHDLLEGEVFLLFGGDLSSTDPCKYKRVGNDIYHWVGRINGSWSLNTTDWFSYKYSDYAPVYIYLP